MFHETPSRGSQNADPGLDLGRRPTSAVTALDAKITAQSSKTDHSECHQYYDLDYDLDGSSTLFCSTFSASALLCARGALPISWCCTRRSNLWGRDRFSLYG
jgi:hypothetical protein